jgi:hypothetical protein
MFVIAIWSVASLPHDHGPADCSQNQSEQDHRHSRAVQQHKDYRAYQRGREAEAEQSLRHGFGGYLPRR